MSTGTAGLYRLLAWLSPVFPTGAFSYSHGLEAVAESGVVRDRATLEAWIRAVIVHGSGRVDADILRDAWCAAEADDDAALAEVNRRGGAYRATAELALEAGQQGAAFLVAYEAAWASPHPNPPPLAGEGIGERANVRSHPPALDPSLSRDVGEGLEAPARNPLPRVAGAGGSGRNREAGEGICHAAVFGAAAARTGVSLGDTLTAYLSAFAANLMSAGLRLGIIGQSDGQRILAALEPAVAAAVAASLARGMQDFGSATFATDLASMAHETQYTRLFRS